MDWKWKEAQHLEASISRYEFNLGLVKDQPERTQTSGDDHSNSEVEDTTEAAMVTTPVVGDAPAVSIMPETSTFLPGEEQTHPLEVEDDC